MLKLYLKDAMQRTDDRFMVLWKSQTSAKLWRFNTIPVRSQHRSGRSSIAEMMRLGLGKMSLQTFISMCLHDSLLERPQI